MLYKELLDAMLLSPHPIADDPTSLDGSQHSILPTETTFSWSTVFTYVGVEMDTTFSDHFVQESRPIVIGNGLRYNVADARTLREMVNSWIKYVATLGLGSPRLRAAKKPVAALTSDEANKGRTENRLQLVYRRAGPAKSKRHNKSKAITTGRQRAKRKGENNVRDEHAARQAASDEDVDDLLLQHAIEESLKANDSHPDSGVGDAVEEPFTGRAQRTQQPMDDPDEDAWAAQVVIDDQLGDAEGKEQQVTLRISQVHSTRHTQVDLSSPLSSAPSTPSPSSSSPPSPDRRLMANRQTKSAEKTSTKSGSIVGETVFSHSPRILATHLSSVLQWWMGEREAVGVSIHDTRRCEWCEFEEGCEWRYVHRSIRCPFCYLMLCRTKKAAEALDNSKKSRQI